jgi:hypothetical protein
VLSRRHSTANQEVERYSTANQEVERYSTANQEVERHSTANQEVERYSTVCFLGLYCASEERPQEKGTVGNMLSNEERSETRGHQPSRKWRYTGCIRLLF